jgi:SAM-dependent methyltransferase
VNPSLACIDCHHPLERVSDEFACAHCGARFPVDDEIADFSRGEYYDHFDPQHDHLSEEHLRGLALEVEGSVRRIRDYYVPLLRRDGSRTGRVLDAGCGNGVSVDTLRAAGYEAWGNDLSQLRKHQWRERASREFLVVASALRLPFEDAFFDAVISSGVLEHIGVAETPAPAYSAVPLPDQRAQRLAFMRELARVVRPGGRIFLDFPHGSFPIDFWHGNSPGTPRVHSLREGFLPSYAEVRELARSAFGVASVRALSPRGRLQFHQASGHLHGRLLRLPMRLLFRAMEVPGLRWIAASPLNPFLVVEVRKE